MRTSYFGITLVGLYVLVSILSVVYGIYTEDSKGRFVLFQIPILLQMGLVYELGLREYLHNLSWGEAYLLLGLPTIFLLYLFGLAIDAIRKSILK